MTRSSTEKKSRRTRPGRKATEKFEINQELVMIQGDKRDRKFHSGHLDNAFPSIAMLHITEGRGLTLSVIGFGPEGQQTESIQGFIHHDADPVLLYRLWRLTDALTAVDVGSDLLQRLSYACQVAQVGDLSGVHPSYRQMYDEVREQIGPVVFDEAAHAFPDADTVRSVIWKAEEHGIEIDLDAVSSAVADGKIQATEWLLKNGVEDPAIRRQRKVDEDKYLADLRPHFQAVLTELGHNEGCECLKELAHNALGLLPYRITDADVTVAIVVSKLLTDTVPEGLQVMQRMFGVQPNPAGAILRAAEVTAKVVPGAREARALASEMMMVKLEIAAGKRDPQQCSKGSENES